MNPSENHFPTINRLVTAEKRCNAAVGVDMTRFGMRRQVNSAKIKIKSVKISPNFNFVHF